MGMGDAIFSLFVQRTYAVMSNDVLIAVPLFVFMGYLVERANILDRLFRSIQMAFGAHARLAGDRDAGHLRPVRHRHRDRRRHGDPDGPAGASRRCSAPATTSRLAATSCAGGSLGILIPPSVMLILYGATAGVSVVKLYAGVSARPDADRLLPAFVILARLHPARHGAASTARGCADLRGRADLKLVHRSCR